VRVRQRQQGSTGRDRAGNRIQLEKILDYQDIHSITWDEYGVLWLLSGGHRLVVSTILGSKPGAIQSGRSIERRGNERAGQGQWLRS
jgi:hypothetical protein